MTAPIHHHPECGRNYFYQSAYISETMENLRSATSTTDAGTATRRKKCEAQLLEYLREVMERHSGLQAIFVDATLLQTQPDGSVAKPSIGAQSLRELVVDELNVHMKPEAAQRLIEVTKRCSNGSQGGGWCQYLSGVAELALFRYNAELHAEYPELNWLVAATDIRVCSGSALISAVFQTDLALARAIRDALSPGGGVHSLLARYACCEFRTAVTTVENEEVQAWERACGGENPSSVKVHRKSLLNFCTEHNRQNVSRNDKYSVVQPPFADQTEPAEGQVEDVLLMDVKHLEGNGPLQKPKNNNACVHPKKKESAGVVRQSHEQLQGNYKRGRVVHKVDLSAVNQNQPLPEHLHHKRSQQESCSQLCKVMVHVLRTKKHVLPSITTYRMRMTLRELVGIMSQTNTSTPPDHNTMRVQRTDALACTLAKITSKTPFAQALPPAAFVLLSGVLSNALLRRWLYAVIQDVLTVQLILYTQPLQCFGGRQLSISRYLAAAAVTVSESTRSDLRYSTTTISALKALFTSDMESKDVLFSFPTAVRTEQKKVQKKHPISKSTAPSVSSARRAPHDSTISENSRTFRVLPAFTANPSTIRKRSRATIVSPASVVKTSDASSHAPERSDTPRECYGESTLAITLSELANSMGDTTTVDEDSNPGTFPLYFADDWGTLMVSSLGTTYIDDPGATQPQQSLQRTSKSMG